MNDEQMKKICLDFRIGMYQQDLSPLSGGLMHEMFRFSTDTGHFVVKRLNQQIMKRKTARANFIQSEDVASAAAKLLPALPALRQDGPLYAVGESCCLLFPWIDGQTLKTQDLCPMHAEAIGNVLGTLHRAAIETTPSIPSASSEYVPIDWNGFLQQGQMQNKRWARQLGELVQQLRAIEADVCRSMKTLGNDCVISHRDLDPKNVMWTTTGPVVIDWESAGPIHPMLDLFETACYWSSRVDGTYDAERFSSFLNGYATTNQVLDVDWHSVIDRSVHSKLDWLVFNLDRSLDKTDSSEAEQRLGTEQVIQTLAELRRHDREKWYDWLQTIV